MYVTCSSRRFAPLATQAGEKWLAWARTCAVWLRMKDAMAKELRTSRRVEPVRFLDWFPSSKGRGEANPRAASGRVSQTCTRHAARHAPRAIGLSGRHIRQTAPCGLGRGAGDALRARSALQGFSEAQLAHRSLARRPACETQALDRWRHTPCSLRPRRDAARPRLFRAWAALGVARRVPPPMDLRRAPVCRELAIPI